MPVTRLADLLQMREERMEAIGSRGVITPMGDDLWGTSRFGSDPRHPSEGRQTGFVFGSSVWGLDSFGTRASSLAAKYGVTPDEEV